MIDQHYCQSMARYNQWMNNKLIAACESLAIETLKEDRGAFFKSILRTLEHLYFADGVIFELTSGIRQENAVFGEYIFNDFQSYKLARIERDKTVLTWVNSFKSETVDAFMHEEIAYGCPMRLMPKDMQSEDEIFTVGHFPRAKIIMHLFNHQAHHRGQVTTLLAQLGVVVDDTDLWLAP